MVHIQYVRLGTDFRSRAFPGKNNINSLHGKMAVLVILNGFPCSCPSTVLSAKSDSDVTFCLHSYLGLRIDRSIV